MRPQYRTRDDIATDLQLLYCIVFMKEGIVEQGSEKRPMRSAVGSLADHVSSIVNVADLMRDQREITLQHGTEAYKLRITSKGKLILTK
jgi:hemin uptake protein HemP